MYCKKVTGTLNRLKSRYKKFFATFQFHYDYFNWKSYVRLSWPCLFSEDELSIFPLNFIIFPNHTLTSSFNFRSKIFLLTPYIHVAKVWTIDNVLISLGDGFTALGVCQLLQLLQIVLGRAHNFWNWGLSNLLLLINTADLDFS